MMVGRSAVVVAAFMLVAILVEDAECDSKLRLCHEIECPQDAASCTKSFTASPDNKKLITTYSCDGPDGSVITSKVNEEVNKQFDTKVHQPYKITKQFLVI
ncbi:PREDICTED: uncharacterized protein LOC108564542 [Nicrophorus vespilloides]|uniref:Uncharacterized protein LOC108564542 n=1 Tax=Nicrophorus vespilloides TaxID=110193 RepID=A0ABM1MX04_NICVS|nr:PREDICTED: uncharacterized protein LOC108564542 [Nicrophorus vespilloides]